VKGEDEIPDNISTKKETGYINRDFVVFAFFLFLSFCLWYFNYLGKEMEADIRYPVKYINVPNNRDVKAEIPPRLNLTLKGPGYSVLKQKVAGKPPVIIDLSKVSYRKVPGTRSPEYFIVTTSLAKSMTVQLRSGCEIINVKPDTLYFTIGNETARPVPGSAEK
jgi:hypothetical protein